MTTETRSYYSREEMAKLGYYPISGWPGYYMNENKAVYHMESGEPEYVEVDGEVCAMIGPRHDYQPVPIDSLEFSKTYQREMMKAKYQSEHTRGDMELYTRIPGYDDVYVGPEFDVVTDQGFLHHIVSVTASGEMRYRLTDSLNQTKVITGQQLMKNLKKRR